jgi:hypothetical protein
VDVLAGGKRQRLKPNGAGRLRFTVDLGPPHADQQFTVASRAAGEDAPGYFTSRSVTFAPHARLVLDRVRLGHSGAKACVSALGPPIRRARLALVDSHGKRVAPVKRIRPRDKVRCVRLRAHRPLEAAKYLVRAVGKDRYGHRVVERARAR